MMDDLNILSIKDNSKNIRELPQNSNEIVLSANDVIEDSGSKNIKTVITDEILKEEKQLEEKAILDEKEFKQKLVNDNSEKDECFKRLLNLLKTSTIYAKYLAQKLLQCEDMKKESLKEPQDATYLSKRKRKKEDSESFSLKKRKSNSHVIDICFKENEAQDKPDDTHNKIDCLKIANGLNISDRQPKLVTGGKMHPYQLDGYEWLKNLYENGANGILADEMGLGKTLQSIAFIAYLVEMGLAGPFFVCGPLSTVPNWYAEFQKFAPDLPLLLYHGSKEERKKLFCEINKKSKVNNSYCCPIVITSYQIALIDAPMLSKIMWKMLVIDEAHRIKNFQCKLIQALKEYNSLHRLLLTGTPLQNDLTELWSLLNFILPEIFDDLQVFHSWFDVSKIAEDGGTQEIIALEQEKQIISTIHQILTPFLLRRTKSDIALKLPPKKELIVHCPFTALQHDYYTSVLNNTIRQTLFAENKKEDELFSKRKSKKTEFFGCENEEHSLFKSDAMNNIESIPVFENIDTKNISEINIKLNKLDMCLRKICCHPYLISRPLNPATREFQIDEDIVKVSGKLLVLDALLPELKRRGHKVLLFSQFTSMLEILEEYCSFRNFEFACLYGTMSLFERQEQLNSFKDSSTFIFLISTKAGGLGINLVSADTVIIYDSDWNPQCDLQAQDRCHRIGQTKPVVVYRLVVPNSVDQKVFDYASAKRKLEKVIIQKGRFNTKNTLSKQSKAITKDELLDLLGSSDSCSFIKTNSCVLPAEELEKLLDRSDMM